jgi:hypothetical protein
VENAFFQIQAELKKARERSSSSNPAEASPTIQGAEESLRNQLQLDGLMPGFDFDSIHEPDGQPFAPLSSGEVLLPAGPTSLAASPNDLQPTNSQAPRREQGTVSNPLALLADASGAAQTLELRSAGSQTFLSTASELSSAPQATLSSTYGSGLSRSLLRRPGSVFLGLSPSTETLETGLDALFATAVRNYEKCSYYFQVARYITNS